MLGLAIAAYMVFGRPKANINDINAGSVDNLVTNNRGSISLLSLNTYAVKHYIYP